MSYQIFTANQTLTSTQMNNLQSSVYTKPRSTQSGSTYTLQLSDKGTAVEFTNFGQVSITVPLMASVTFPVGSNIEIINAGTGSLEFVAPAGLTINSEGDILSLGAQWASAILTKRTGDNWILRSLSTSVFADGTIVNADISATAAIAHTKLANATAGQVLLGTTTTGVVTATTISGDVSITGAGVTAIGSGVIVNADVNASAAIALSKLASGASGQIVVHSSGGVPTATTVSGDVTIDSTGIVQIATDKIVNADINSAAAIVDTKLATISTAGKVSNSATTATDANTVSAIVARDASGNFIAGKATLATADINTIIETASITASAAGGTINIDFSTNPTVYYTLSSTANCTINIRGTSSTTLNSVLATGQIATVTFLETCGATPYYPTIYQIDGVAVTPKFMGGTAPTTGNANSIDAYTLSIIKTGSAAFTVLASQTKFA